MTPQPSAECALLLRGLREPLQIGGPQWDRVLRLARMTGLHGRLAATNLDSPALPDAVRRHLLSAARMSAFSARMLDAEIRAVAPLCTAEFPVIALKGGAYALQGLAFAHGRFVSDIDLLVPAAALRTMEHALQRAGWAAARLDPYDERYYRDWSHETPPMRFPGHVLELDLHHAITPVTGRLHFDPAPLFEASVAVPGSPFRVLAPEDQLLHACVHCFQDGDLALRLREIADIDGLLHSFAERPGFWPRLGERAHQLGLGHALWFGLHYARAWTHAPVPADVLASLPAPTGPAAWLMAHCTPLAMLPSDPDHPPSFAVRLARLAMLARYHLRRMPPHLLLPHLTRKAMLRLRARHGRGEGENDEGQP
jgi:hypothetical protein